MTELDLTHNAKGATMDQQMPSQTKANKNQTRQRWCKHDKSCKNKTSVRLTNVYCRLIEMKNPCAHKQF